MDDKKKKYLKDLAKMDWESGHPFSSDDFRYFQRCCKDDGYEMTPEDFSYYWTCFEDCRSEAYS